MYRQLESTLCGGSIPVDKYLRPHRIDYPRVIVELSRTLTAMTLKEPLELTIYDCALREHNEYMRMLQPRSEDGEPLTPPISLIRMVEKSMRTVGDGLCVRKEGQNKYRTRASNENIDKISKRFQESRQHHKSRLPTHDAILEVKTFGETTEPASMYVNAPLGVALLRLYLNRELKMTNGTNAGAMQTEIALGSPSLKKYLEKQDSQDGEREKAS